MKTGERVFGIVITSIGILLLVVVFLLAYEMLTHPVPGLKEALTSTAAAPGGSVNSLGGVGFAVIDFLLKLAVLFVMTLAGSHISARGIQFFHAAPHASAEPSVASRSNLLTAGSGDETAGFAGTGESTGRQ